MIQYVVHPPFELPVLAGALVGLARGSYLIVHPREARLPIWLHYALAPGVTMVFGFAFWAMIRIRKPFFPLDSAWLFGFCTVFGALIAVPTAIFVSFLIRLIGKFVCRLIVQRTDEPSTPNGGNGGDLRHQTGITAIARPSPNRVNGES